MDTATMFVSLGAGFGLGVAGTWFVLRSKIQAAAERARFQAGNEISVLTERLSHKEQLESELQQLRKAQEVMLKESVEVKAKLENERKGTTEKLALLEQAKINLTDAFNSLSADALSKNNQSFLHLAKTTLEKYQENAKGDLDKRQQSIAELVKPVRESLKDVETQIQRIEKDRVGAYSGLAQQVELLARNGNELRAETSKLAKALTNPGIRGRWGEIQLRRVVELAGMLDRCDFVEQHNVTTEDGRLRPDLTIRLPGGKNIVVDAKAPLTAFIEAIDALDENAREQKFKEHARRIQDHMKMLRQKAYWEQFQPAPEFIVLFLPGEAFFSAALQHAPELIEQGIVDHRVILASPTTLISLLKAVAHGWREERLAANAQEISNLGKELYKRIATMSEHFVALGERLAGAVDFYNKTARSIESRVLVSARKFHELSDGSEDMQISEPSPITISPHQPQLSELSEPALELSKATDTPSKSSSVQADLLTLETVVRSA